MAERRIGIRELKSKLSECVREVKGGGTIVVTDRGDDIEGDALLVPVRRRPAVGGLDLERAGVTYSERGIAVYEHPHYTLSAQTA